MIENAIDVMYYQQQTGGCSITRFTGNDRLERALRFAQGLLDEHIAYYMRERTEDLDSFRYHFATPRQQK